MTTTEDWKGSKLHRQNCLATHSAPFIAWHRDGEDGRLLLAVAHTLGLQVLEARDQLEAERVHRVLCGSIRAVPVDQVEEVADVLLRVLLLRRRELHVPSAGHASEHRRPDAIQLTLLLGILAAVHGRDQLGQLAVEVLVGDQRVEFGEEVGAGEAVAEVGHVVEHLEGLKGVDGWVIGLTGQELTELM
jgi:hypothetical protein